ncbi:hypothetical protein PINS_up013999 [Pythium insidiosum]|nr:hypothetical protein PINS_up013999 [Pythium insidiosum]
MRELTKGRVDSLSNNQLDDECAESLGALVAAAQPSNGATVDLRNNELSENALRQLARAAVTNRCLLSLRLEGNPEETSSATLARRQIDAALHRNERLRRHRTMLKMLPEIRESSLSVMSCKLEYVELTIADAQSLSVALRMNRSITELRLRDNVLPPEGARRILAALERHISLTSLALMDNNPGDIGLLAASRLVRQSATLQTLHIVNSRQIEASPISRLTAAHWHHTMARDSTATRQLALVHCGLTDLDIGVIASGIASSCQAQYLSFRGNGITDRSVHVLVRVIGRCQHLRHLDIVRGDSVFLFGCGSLVMCHRRATTSSH